MEHINAFIATYPGLIYALIVALVGIVGYQYREGKKQERSALLNEVGKVATAIETMAHEIKALFKKDKDKEDRIDALAERVSVAESRCAERAKICPGINRHRRFGDTEDHTHLRLPGECQAGEHG